MLTCCRFLLRRAAVRTVLLQTSRQISNTRFASSPSPFLQPTQPTISRAFHQSRLWRAPEDEQKPIEVTPEGEAVADEAIEAAAVAETAAEAAVEAEQAVDAAQSSEEAAAATQVAEEAAAVADGAAEVANLASSVAPTPQNEAASAQATIGAGVAAAAATTAAHASHGNLQSATPRTSGARWSAPSAGQPPSDRVLYVGNLFFEVTVEQVEAEFSKFGQIVNSRMAVDERGLSKGFAFLEFESADSAARAIREADQKVLAGRRMAVQLHVPRPRRFERHSVPQGGSAPSTAFLDHATQRSSNPPSKTLFVGNLSFAMSDRDLNDLFREVEDVIDIRVAIDRQTGRPRGFAHADFIDESAATRAKVLLENKEVHGRHLRVDYSARSSSSRQA